MPIAPGHYPDLSNEAYHADPAIGSSGINAFLECPAIFHANYMSEEKPARKESNAMRIGSCAHIAMLEPEKFNQTYVILDNEKVTKKTVKAWLDFAEEAKGSGKLPLLHKEYRQIFLMAEKIKEHEIAYAILTGAVFEQSFFIQCQETGLMLKSRPDILRKVADLGIVLADYKTTGISLDIQAQSRYAFNCGRHRQGAHHPRAVEEVMGEKIDQVLYITQSTEYPYLVRVFRMPEEELKIGDNECRAALRGIVRCSENGIWPGYPQGIDDYQYNPFWKDKTTETLMELTQ